MCIWWAFPGLLASALRSHADFLVAGGPAVYPYYLAAAAYPDYTRRPLPVADWGTFQNQPQFVVSRRGAVDESYFTGSWKVFRLLFTPTNAGFSTLKIQNIDCDGTVLVDDVQFRVAGGVPEVSPGPSTNLLANPGFENTDPCLGWTRTPGANVYQDGHNSAHSMLVRAGHSLEATVSVGSEKTYELAVWVSIAGRSRGVVRVSAGGPNMGSATVDIAEEITSAPSGFVLWPTVNTIVEGLRPAELDAITRHHFILHNPWGYVPVDRQALASASALATITNQLQNRYTGADIGEQEARFANVFEAVYEPFSLTDRFRHYQVALRYTEQVGNDLGNIMGLLVNLWFWHYPIKNANVLIAGAQAQPKEGVCNSQVQYSFLRGAGKQYGVPWFGNASVFCTDWDREGPQKNWKTYPSQATNGSSLNLMRRLMFTHYLYGCGILSFESGWRVDQKTVSPIGMVQEAMVQTVNQYGRPGVMHTPIALLLDFYSGWMPAQYNRGNYYVWNAVDYGPGDHLTHNVFSLLYSHYEANGFFQNELGGLSDTPFGDMADTLLTDVTSPVLSRYGVVIAAGNLPSADTELREKVDAFLSSGGDFIVTGENARRLWPEFGIGRNRIPVPMNASFSWRDGTTTTEIHAGSLYSIEASLLPPQSEVLASYSDSPAVIEIPRGPGRITVLTSPFGMNDSSLTDPHPPYAWGYNAALPKPYVLMSHVRKILEDRISGQRLFEVGNSKLGYIACRQGPSQYLLGIHNNSLTSQPFRISSFIGPIQCFWRRYPIVPPARCRNQQLACAGVKLSSPPAL
ncbi:MAG: hypothetical protein NT154_03155 [Verrucomicrobia bacterium]|nr:hypothetical protein [Verrucomicrobiota bacterium]